MRHEVVALLDSCLTQMLWGKGLDAGFRSYSDTHDGELSRAVKRMLGRIEQGTRRRMALLQLAVEMSDPDLTHVTEIIVGADASGDDLHFVLRSLRANCRRQQPIPHPHVSQHPAFS